MKGISFNKEHDYNEGVFVARKESNYTILTTSNFKFLDLKNYIRLDLSYSACCK